MLVPALTVLTAALAFSGPVQAARSEAKVTFVARQCPAYADIMANRARNNIQESLADPGEDSTYSDGQAVDPGVETREDPARTPPTGWTFTLGNGIGGKTDGLTVISGSPVGTARTAASTPLLDAQGRDTGQTLEGATTLTLSDARSQNARRDRLTVQGGTPSEMVVAPPPPTVPIGPDSPGVPASPNTPVPSGSPASPGLRIVPLTPSLPGQPIAPIVPLLPGAPGSGAPTGHPLPTTGSSLPWLLTVLGLGVFVVGSIAYLVSLERRAKDE